MGKTVIQGIIDKAYEGIMKRCLGSTCIDHFNGTDLKVILKGAGFNPETTSDVHVLKDKSAVIKQLGTRLQGMTRDKQFLEGVKTRLDMEHLKSMITDENLSREQTDFMKHMVTGEITATDYMVCPPIYSLNLAKELVEDMRYDMEFKLSCISEVSLKASKVKKGYGAILNDIIDGIKCRCLESTPNNPFCKADLGKILLDAGYEPEKNPDYWTYSRQEDFLDDLQGTAQVLEDCDEVRSRMDESYKTSNNDDTTLGVVIDSFRTAVSFIEDMRNDVACKEQDEYMSSDEGIDEYMFDKAMEED